MPSDIGRLLSNKMFLIEISGYLLMVVISVAASILGVVPDGKRPGWLNMLLTLPLWLVVSIGMLQFFFLGRISDHSWQSAILFYCSKGAVDALARHRAGLNFAFFSTSRLLLDRFFLLLWQSAAWFGHYAGRIFYALVLFADARLFAVGHCLGAFFLRW